MKTNEIKKGTRIQLANGWFGTMMDNRRGNIRMAEVEGMYTEMGSVYAWDIKRVLVGEYWVPVELTPAQRKARRAASLFS